MPGKLVVCPTPIGNLEDITLRARRALYEADVIACEDTRRTGLLLERLEIQALRLISYHEGNEAERARELSQRIERGDNVALVSDAGTPAISDPGFRLIRACIDRDLDIEVLPGPRRSSPRWSSQACRPIASASRASCRGGPASWSGSSNPPRR